MKRGIASSTNDSQSIIIFWTIILKGILVVRITGTTAIAMEKTVGTPINKKMLKTMSSMIIMVALLL